MFPSVSSGSVNTTRSSKRNTSCRAKHHRNNRQTAPSTFLICFGSLAMHSAPLPQSDVFIRSSDVMTQIYVLPFVKSKKINMFLCFV